MWNNYPVAAALGVTTWGVSRLSYAFGMGGYSNPYYDEGGGGGYDYSQPVAAYQPTADELPAATAGTAAATTPPAASEKGMSLFDRAARLSPKGSINERLDLCNQTLKTMPNDAVVHEFRSLVLFACRIIARRRLPRTRCCRPGPDGTGRRSAACTEMSRTTPRNCGLWSPFVKQNPKSSDGHFLLAYQYLTTGHSDAAQAELREVDKLTPNDRLVRQLLGLTSAAGEDAAKPTPQPPLDDDKLIKAEQLVGVWTAAGSGGSKFQMTLNKDSSFAWKFTSGKKSDEIKGVFAVQQNNLALQVDDGSVMLGRDRVVGQPARFKVIAVSRMTRV